MLPWHDQNVFTRVPLRSLLTLQLRMVYTHSGFNTTIDLRAFEKKKIQRKLRTDSFANSYWDRPIFCKFCTVTDVPSDRKVSVTFPHLVCMYMYSKKWRNVYICLTYDLRLKNMYVHFFVSIFFGSFIILWLQKCVIASKITFLLQRSGAFEF